MRYELCALVGNEGAKNLVSVGKADTRRFLEALKGQRPRGEKVVVYTDGRYDYQQTIFT